MRQVEDLGYYTKQTLIEINNAINQLNEEYKGKIVVGYPSHITFKLDDLEFTIYQDKWGDL